MRVVVTIDPDGRSGDLIAPTGLMTPHAHAAGLEVTGAELLRETLADGQVVAVIRSDGQGPVTLTYTFAQGGDAYPDEMFVPRDSRYTRAAEAVAEDAHAFEAADDVALAVANHVAGLFNYGHVDKRFYEDHDHIPHLCGTTKGSCVDINAYFMASLRAAGVEAGYITGAFFPAEKMAADGSAWCNDMHCWVVTRCGHGVREWDIAHHLKMGTSNIRAALDPKPGFRLPLAHSMGHDIASLGLHDVKLLSDPMWVGNGALEPAKAEIRFHPAPAVAPAATP